jgi:protoporphyrinogen oxidase
MPNAVIVGAGPAGLTAAYELSKLGIGSTVLEADRQVGGLSRTVNYRGYRFDIGGHRFFTKVPLINELWTEILGEDFLLRPRLSRIHYRGHFFDYPLKATNALAGLGPIEALIVGMSFGKAKLFPHAEETNLEQWVSNRFGHRLYEIFFKTYTEKVWGIPCNEISADWAAQRIKNLSLPEAVKNALFGNGKAKNGEIITTLIEQFNYPRYGPGMMWERCEELLREKGNETVRGIKVEEIRHRHGRVECVYGRTHEGEFVEFGGDEFISTMPLRSLIRVLSPAAPDEVLEAANKLRYRDYLTVVLIAKREKVFPDNWIYIHSPEVKMGRIQNYKNWSPYMVPDPSKSSLGLEYFLWDKDEEWNWSRDRLVELGIEECAKINLIERDEIEDGTVVRMKKAYPVYDRDYQDSLATIQNYLETIANLQTVGRNGLHRYNNQDHSMLTAVYAARNIVGEKNDVWSVNTEMEYHEEARVKVSESKPPIVEQSPVTAAGDRMVPRRLTPEELIEAAFAKLDAVALGVAVGIVTGVTLFIATIALLLKGGPVVGPTLSLLNNVLLGFRVSVPGAVIGLVEACVGGFMLGYLFATLRNVGIDAYAWLLQRRAMAESERSLLD